MSEKPKKRLKPEIKPGETVANLNPDPDLTPQEQNAAADTPDLSAELKALTEQLKRMQAEYDNYRKRKNDEYEEYKKYVALELFKTLLPVLDNLERAADAALNTQEPEALQKGIELVVRQFKEILNQEGIRELPGVGELFDPNNHEAIMREERGDVPEGTILQVLQKGYKFKDRLLRPSLVKVSG